MSDHEKLTDEKIASEKLAEAVEIEMLRTQLELSTIIRVAAHHALEAITNRAGAAGTSQLADIAYAFACLKGAPRGVLPENPPSKNSAPAATPPAQPTSSPQPGQSLPRFDDPSRKNR